MKDVVSNKDVRSQDNTWQQVHIGNEAPLFAQTIDQHKWDITTYKRTGTTNLRNNKGLVYNNLHLKITHRAQ